MLCSTAQKIAGIVKKPVDTLKIAFKEKKIDSDPEAFEDFKQLRATGVPVIFVGRKRMNGFNQSTFDQLFYGEKS